MANNNLLRCFIFFVVLTSVNCKKDDTNKSNTKDPEITVLAFNHGAVSTLNKKEKEIVVSIADYTDRKALVAIFSLSPGAVATVDGVLQKSSETPNNFTQPVTYTITSNGKSVNWTVRMVSNNYEIGLGTEVQAEKRLIRDYEWYQAQDSSGVLGGINGGPTCLAMASIWANRLAFANASASKIREDLRFQNLCSTINMAQYLNDNLLSWRFAHLTSDHTTITDAIDKGYLIILLVDISLVPLNRLIYQHTDRYYETYPFKGHYILVKGYKKVDGNMYYEVYDPFTQNQRYSTNGEIKGRNRYYLASAVQKAASSVYGWKYGIVIHEKTIGNGYFDLPVRNEVSKTELADLLDPQKPFFQVGF